MRVEDIARVTHEANRAYCRALGDESQAPWDLAPEWQRKSAINGVCFHMEHELLTNGIDSHANWMREKIADGWIYGLVKDEKAKTHPCLVPYHELPLEQRLKDTLFVAVVRALTGSVK